MLNVKTPVDSSIEQCFESVPSIIEYVKVLILPSKSVAITAPISVWFSLTMKDAFEVNTGALSFKLIRFTEMSCVVDNKPSLTRIFNK